MRSKYVIIPILIHVIVILGLFTFLVISGRNYREMLLVDDDYYEIAKNFVQGATLLHTFRGPVLPFILSVLFIFPENVRPFVRLLISLVMSAGVIIVVYRIMRNYISKKQFLIGSLVFILNPVYIHWTFRSSPELFLAFLLGLLMLCILNFLRTKKPIHAFFAAVVLFLSFFIKPVFLFIPFSLLFFALITKSRCFVLTSILLVLTGVAAYGVQDKVTKKIYSTAENQIGRTRDYKHKIFLITDSFWTDYVLKTKQFYKPTMAVYDRVYKDGEVLGKYIDNWIRNFYEKFPNGSVVHLNLYFIYKKPLLVMQKLLVSPFFYFAMSARQLETFVKLLFSVVSIIFAVLGLRTVLKKAENRREIVVIISTLVGFVALHLVTHAMNRYSLPVLPYLYIWAGIPLMRLGTWFRNALRPRAVIVTHDESDG